MRMSDLSSDVCSSDLALLESPYTCRSVLVIAEQADRLSGLVPHDVPVYALPARAIEAVTGVHFQRGVLAVAERPALPSVRDVVRGARRVLVLEGVNDHANIGSLFRNAAAFGVGAVLPDPKNAAPHSRRPTRVSTAHLPRVPFNS